MEPKLKIDGRYTAYHVYQGLSFSEANRASTVPYKALGFRCAHSQRGYLFQFDSMVERNHFAAANTSCCDEPVLNFANKPQYSGSSRPMSPSDCRRVARAHGCEVLEISVDDLAPICASESAQVTRIRIKCPKFCPEFSSMTAGETFSGKYGKFRMIGIEAGDFMIMDYQPDQVILDDAYARCSGRVVLTETFCGGHSLEFSVLAGLDFPGGCGCDCCGQKGLFPAPSLVINAGEAIASNWNNTIGFQSGITGDSACNGAEISGAFIGVNGSTPVSWEGPSKYVSDGVERYVQRKPSSAGSSGNPACCGGFLEWRASDGCGSVKTKTTQVIRRLSGHSIQPASGSNLSDGATYEFSVLGVCSHADSAGLELSTVCLDNVQGPVSRLDGALKRGFGRSLTLTSSPDCSSCCGSGSVRLTFSDGCGGTGAANYSVRKGLSYGASSLLIGKKVRVARNYVAQPSPGYVYDLEMAPIYCDGGSGQYSRAYWGSYSTVSACESQIKGAPAPFINSEKARSGLVNASTCLFYTDNGQDGLSLVSMIFSVYDKCCVMDSGNISWINRADASRCCPK